MFNLSTNKFVLTGQNINASFHMLIVVYYGNKTNTPDPRLRCSRGLRSSTNGILKDSATKFLGWVKEERIMKRLELNSLFVVVLILTLGLSLSVGGLAWAIPDSQQDCTGGGGTSSTSFEFIPGLEVTVKAGQENCILTLSAEAGMSNANPTDHFLLRYAFDSDDPSDCERVGPEEIKRGADALQDTRTLVGVVNLGPGFHTIKPCFSIDPAGPTGNIAFPCLTVECRTR
jgi:hypothetical protein